MTTAAPRTPAPVTAPRRARITRPADPLERDADRMADAALAATPVAATATAGADTVMRQAAGGPEFEDDDDFDVAPAARPGRPAPAPHGFLEAVRSSGGGHGIAEPQRGRFEHGFGRPLDHVRIHDDAAAARLADNINARAFTHGTDVFFAHGEHRPGAEGDRLLAHELAHTLQRPGPGTIARQPKKKPAKSAAKPKLDPSRMTDEEKIVLRKKIEEAAQQGVDEWYTEFERDQKKSPGHYADEAKRWIRTVDAAIADAGKITDAAQSGPRLAYLQAHRRLFDDPFYVWALTTKNVGFAGGPGILGYVGNRANKLTPQQLQLASTIAAAAAAGAKAYIGWVGRGQIYGDLGIDPKQLETAEQSAAEATGGAGAPASQVGAIGGETIEDRKTLEELNTALGDLASEAGDDDPAVLAFELSKLSDEQRKDFYAFTRKMLEAQKDSPDKKTTFDLLELYNKLDPASREALTLNREMEEAEPGKEEALPDKVLLNVRKEATQTEQTANTARAIQNSLDAIKAVTKDPEAKKKLAGLSLDDAFLQELAMLRGLLAGGGRESPLVESAGQVLIHEINAISDYLQQRLLKLAAKLVAAEALTVLTEGAAAPELLVLLDEINEVRKLIEKLRQAYRIYERIKGVIDFITGIRSKYDDLVAKYHEAADLYTKLQATLAKLESGEGVDEALEQLEDQMLERLETLVEEYLGGLLELLYIPADTSFEQLQEILFNIPRGIDALGEMWRYYTEGNSKADQFAEILAIKAFKAGRLLYPFVGMTAALVAKGIQAAFADKSSLGQIEKLMPGSGDAPATIRERTLGAFRRLFRKRYDLDPATAGAKVAGAKAALEKALQNDEPAGPGGAQYWAPAWFRASVRRDIKVVNQQFKGQTIKATRKVKGGGKQDEQIPLPPFRAKVKRSWFGRTRKLRATIKLNPDDTVERNELSNAAFKGDGEEFVGTKPDRQEAIRKWLRDTGYEVHKDPDGNEYIRLPHGERETSERSYLRFDQGRIKAGIDKEKGWKPFIGRLIHDSRDLPEGYYAVHLKTVDTVSLKSGLGKNDHQVLGLDDQHKLKTGAGKAKPLTLRKSDVKIRPEGYDYVSALQTMFAQPKPGEPEYDTTGLTRANWDLHVRTKLQTRPLAVTGNLGYVVRARAAGTKDLNIPELRKNDDRGHLVALRFDGLDDYPNVVPMLRRENRFPGRWYGLETEMAKTYLGPTAQDGHYLHFDLSLIYSSTKTRRPSKFVARVQEMDVQDAKVGHPTTTTVDND